MHEIAKVYSSQMIKVGQATNLTTGVITHHPMCATFNLIHANEQTRGACAE